MDPSAGTVALYADALVALAPIDTVLTRTAMQNSS
jgi:hypothetical protein